MEIFTIFFTDYLGLPNSSFYWADNEIAAIDIFQSEYPGLIASGCVLGMAFAPVGVGPRVLTID